MDKDIISLNKADLSTALQWIVISMVGNYHKHIYLALLQYFSHYNDGIREKAHYLNHLSWNKQKHKLDSSSKTSKNSSFYLCHKIFQLVTWQAYTKIFSFHILHFQRDKLFTILYFDYIFSIASRTNIVKNVLQEKIFSISNPAILYM